MRILKWIATGLAVIVGLVIAAAAVLYAIGGSKFDGPAELRPESIQPATDSGGVAWGRHLALTQGCMECHGQRLEGRVMVDAPPFRVVASNLTRGRGGVGGQLGAADWERAIRHGVGLDGRGLIGYLEGIAAVDAELPATEVKPLGRIIAGTGGLAPASALIDHDVPHTATAPPMAATAEYGAHRAATTCVACHGPRLEGLPPLAPDAPPGPGLAHVKNWTPEQFSTLMRTGVTPAGRQLDPVHMPWPAFAHFQDVELEAIQRYIGTLDAAGEAAATR